MRYTYRGDRLTALALRGLQCDPVRRADGKCVRGKNGNMLVEMLKDGAASSLGGS